MSINNFQYLYLISLLNRLMILGEYPAGVYFQVASIFTISTLFLIYWISQYYGHDKPFPYSWISSIAEHYPEYIFFRTATISGSALLCLGWFTNHFYLQTVGAEKVVNIHKYKPTIMLVMGLMGSFLLMGSTANIDSGQRNSKWHTFCASRFFMFTVVAQIYNTAIYAHLYFKHKAVSRNLTYLKLVQLGCIIVQLYIASKKSFFEHYGESIDENNLDDVKGVILEWTMTLTILIGFLIMSLDVAHFQFVYEKYDSRRSQAEEIPLNPIN